MHSAHFRPSAPTILLWMTVSIVVTYLLGFLIDEEELFLGYFLVISAAYWMLLADASIRSRILAISSPALYLFGYIYATQVSSYSRPIEALQPLMIPYYAIYLSAVVVAFWTMVRVSPSIPHLMQVVLVPCGFVFFFYGSMELLHDWL